MNVSLVKDSKSQLRRGSGGQRSRRGSVWSMVSGGDGATVPDSRRGSNDSISSRQDPMKGTTRNPQMSSPTVGSKPTSGSIQKVKPERQASVASNSHV